LDSFLHGGHIKNVEVINMATNRPNSNTDVQRVRQQNAQSAQGGSQVGAQAGQGQFGTEFASETDVQRVRQQNQKAESRKQQNS